MLDLSLVTDKLSAVNLLLATIDEAPADTLDVTGSVDVAFAVELLDRTSLAVQQKGWHWNTEENIKLVPNVDGNIPLPANTLEVAPLGCFASGGAVRVGERSRMLYNRTDHTALFSEPVTVDLVVALDWDELPTYAKQYIAVRSAKQFQARKQGSSLVDRVTDWEVSDANLRLEEAEDRASPRNQISGNAQLIYRLHGQARRRP